MFMWYVDDSVHVLCLINIFRPALPLDNVRTIQLPVAGCSIPEGTTCNMYGWGETKGTEAHHILIHFKRFLLILNRHIQFWLVFQALDMMASLRQLTYQLLIMTGAERCTEGLSTLPTTRYVQGGEGMRECVK